jgi:hypothetical protein
MKKTLLCLIIIVSISAIAGCVKSKEKCTTCNCVTCTAKKNNETIATTDACSQEDQDIFKYQHTDATVTCQ